MPLAIKTRTITLVILMAIWTLFGVIASAQDTTPPVTPPPAPEATEEPEIISTIPPPVEPERGDRPFMRVENITASADPTTNTLTITVSGMNVEACAAPPEVDSSLVGNVVYVDFRPSDEPAGDIQCITNEAPFSIDVSVPVNQINLRGRDEMYVVTETYLVRIPVSRIETAVGQIPVVTFGEPEPQFRIDVEILAARFEQIEVEIPPTFEDIASEDSGTPQPTPEPQTELRYVIAFTGNVDGCEAPVLSRIVAPEPDETADLKVEVFRPLSIGITCPRNIVQINGNVPLPEDARGILTVLVNDFVFTADPEIQASGQELSDLIRQEPQIDQINVILNGSDPVNVQVQLTGTYSDGCPANLRSDVDVTGTTITLDFYRLVDPAMMCPMVISNFDETIDIGDLPADVYTLNINGASVELNLTGR